MDFKDFALKTIKIVLIVITILYGLSLLLDIKNILLDILKYAQLIYSRI